VRDGPDFGVGVLGQIELGQLDQGLAVLGEEEVVLVFASAFVEGELDGIVVRKIARLDGPDADLNVGGQLVIRAHLALDGLRRVRRWCGLG
jgi:hypothetical protein